MWASFRWRGSASSGLPEARTGRLLQSCMSLRFSCLRQRNSQLHLQEGTGQDNEAPGFEWPDRPQLLGSRRTSHQKTIRAILRSDGKRPGGLTLVPWQSGKALCWDVTVISRLADSIHLGCFPWTRVGSRTCCIPQGSQIRCSWWALPVRASSLWESWCSNASAKLLLTHLGSRLSEKSGESRESGKSLCWDVTVICPLAESYVTGSAREAGAAAKLAASRIGSEYLFAPIVVETLGPMNTSACQLFSNLGRKISSASGDDREGAFLFQRVSVLVPATNCTGTYLPRV